MKRNNIIGLMLAGAFLWNFQLFGQATTTPPDSTKSAAEDQWEEILKELEKTAKVLEKEAYRLHVKTKELSENIEKDLKDPDGKIRSELRTLDEKIRKTADVLHHKIDSLLHQDE